MWTRRATACTAADATRAWQVFAASIVSLSMSMSTLLIAKIEPTRSSACFPVAEYYYRVGDRDRREKS
jgi:hypothetical protein